MVEDEVMVVAGLVGCPDMVVVEVEVVVISSLTEDVDDETCGVCAERTELVAWACPWGSWLVVDG